MFLLAAAGGCIVASACTWEPGGVSACDDFVPTQQDVIALGSWACTIAQEGHVTSGATNSTVLKGEMCDKVCGPGFGNCQLPDQYIQAYLAAQAGGGTEASADASPGVPPPPGDAGASALDGGTPTPDAGGPTIDGDAGPPLLCPNALDSQQFVVLCTNSC